VRNAEGDECLSFRRHRFPVGIFGCGRPSKRSFG
jgi:hypothetical protein